MNSRRWRTPSYISSTPSVLFQLLSKGDKTTSDMIHYDNLMQLAEEKPGQAGYVRLEGYGEKGEVKLLLFAADDLEILEKIYSAIADAILHHPDVIDLRGLEFRIA